MYCGIEPDTCENEDPDVCDQCEYQMPENDEDMEWIKLHRYGVEINER